jgi:SAM-dependent methyltransferase
VVELGGSKSSDHARFFPNATSFTCTNIEGDYDQYQDLRKLSYPDSSVDAFVCVSVLEHVFHVRQAALEIKRTLKVDGSLLITVPFMYPYHGDVDYWRFSVDSISEFFSGYEIRAFVHLGGTISVVVGTLHRAGKERGKRGVLYSALAVGLSAILGRFDRLDNASLGFAVHLIKRDNISNKSDIVVESDKARNERAQCGKAIIK